MQFICLALVFYFNFSVYKEVRRNEKQIFANQVSLEAKEKLLKNKTAFYCTIIVLFTIGHVRYINIQAWLRGFRVKIANFSSFFCLSIPTGDLDTKKTTPNIDVRPESLGPMLEYWYIERGLLSCVISPQISLLSLWYPLWKTASL